MDSAAPHIPSPSAAWSHVAASQGEVAPGGAHRAVLPGPTAPPDEARRLRARLLSMIVDSEHTRKAAATEAFNAR